ncbi:MAG: hypothetical protein GQ575_07290 [Deltaproteobacteria bacterium]|jgi:hypothetical protein|nr:hypothetical protein [Deltaproteobacteria bacterium]
MESETVGLLFGTISYILSTLLGGYTLGCVSQPDWNKPALFREYGLFLILSHWGLLIVSVVLVGSNGNWVIAIILALLKLFILDRFVMNLLRGTVL